MVDEMIHNDVCPQNVAEEFGDAAEGLGIDILDQIEELGLFNDDTFPYYFDGFLSEKSRTAVFLRIGEND